MSARTSLNTNTPYTGSATSGPIDFAGDGGSNQVMRGFPRERAVLLRRVSRLAVALLAAASSFAAAAQSGPAAHVSGAQYLTQVATATTLKNPAGVAVDAAGNVFIVDAGNYRIVEEKADPPGYTETTSTGLPAQSNETVIGTVPNPDDLLAIAVDSEGSVYVTVYTGQTATSSGLQVTRYSREGSQLSTLKIPLNGVSDPDGIVVDSAGNIYVACVSNSGSNSGDGLIVKLTPVIGSHSRFTQSTIVDAPGLSPWGLGMDSSGDFFIADTAGNKVWKATPLTTGTYGLKTIGSGYDKPRGIAVYGTTVYVANWSAQIAALRPESNGDYSSSVIDFGGSNPNGLATDSSGNLFVAADNPSAIFEVEQSTSPFNFGMVNVSQTSAAATLTFTFDAGGKVAAPELESGGNAVQEFGATAVRPVQEEFRESSKKDKPEAVAGLPACKAGTYAAGDSCTVSITFSPLGPGARQGAVIIPDASETPIATVYLNGTGLGAQLSFTPVSPAVWINDTNVSDLTGEIAVDGLGDVYFANAASNTVWLEGGPLGTVSIGSGLSKPKDVALDAAGNVYINDAGNNRILKETPVAGSSPLSFTQSVLFAGTKTTYGLAVDQNGNVFTYSKENLEEMALQPDGSYVTAPVSVLNSGGVKFLLGVPSSIAADGGGNLYFTEGAKLYKLTLAPGAASTYIEVQLAEVGDAQGAAVDATGAVYITSTGGEVTCLRPSPLFGGTLGYKTDVIFPDESFGNPVGIAADNFGSIYVADAGNKLRKIAPQIVRENFAAPPFVDFQDTQIGTDLTLLSAPNSQTVTLTNVGNEWLEVPIPSSGGNPAITAGFTFDAATTCPEITSTSAEEGTLRAAQSCDLVIDFSPSALGLASGWVYLSDESLTASSSYTSWSIALGGTGAPDIPTINWPTPAAIVYGTALNATQLDATATWNGSPVAGTFSYKVGPTYSPSGTPALGAVLPAGAQTIYASFRPSNSAQFSTALAGVSIQVNPAPLTVVADSFSQAYGSPIPKFTASYVGFVNGDTPASLKGAPVMTTEATQLYPWGYYPITVAQGTLASPNYTLTFVDGTLVITQAPLTVTAQNVTVTTGSYIPNPYPCTFSGFVNGDTSAVVSGACATNAQSYSSSPIGNYTVTPALGTLSALNYYFTFAPGTLTLSEATIGSGFHAPEGLAVDANGNVYVTDAEEYFIVKETLANGAFTQSDIELTPASQFGVAVDASGNLYATSSGTNEVWEWTYANGAYTSSVIANSDSGINIPWGIAVDKNGNVFVANFGGSNVMELSPSAGGGFSVSTIANSSVQGLYQPEGIAVDGNGNVYIADAGNERVVIMNYSAGKYSLSNTVFGPFDQLTGVAVDKNGNLYVSAATQSTVYKETPSNGSYTQSVFLAFGLSAPGGVAVDANGNVYIADTGNSRVLEVLATADGNAGETAAGSTTGPTPLRSRLRSALSKPGADTRRAGRL